MSEARTFRRAHLQIEELEHRINPTVYTVTSAVDAVSYSTVTLRDALDAAVTHQAAGAAPAGTGSNTIDFDIPGSGVHIIDVTSPLPAVTYDITINGTTQPGYAGKPLIELDGAGAGKATNGLVLSGTYNTVRGLAIDYFYGNGIVVSSNDNTISGDFVGIDPTGYFSHPNRQDGILVTGGYNTIGGATASALDVISGNAGAGIELSGTLAVGNKIEGDYIGTDALAFAAEANEYGVLVDSGANRNTIGGTTPAYRNIISGNTLDEVRLTGVGTSFSVVEGNFIGPDMSGDAAAESGRDGVRIDSGATYNTIGGTVPGSGNLIGGAGSLNYTTGLEIGVGVEILNSNTTGNIVQGNWIGINAQGGASLPNLAGGIILSDAGTNTIGGTTKSEKNLIADQTNSSGIAGSNQVLASDWYIDSIEFILYPTLLDGSFVV